MKKFLKKLFLVIGIAVSILILFLLVLAFIKPAGFTENIQWGVVFSKVFAVEAGLDWKAAYLAILDDLKVKNIRLPVYWEDVEAQKGNFDFKDYDWMMSEAQKRNVKIILVVGSRLPRWPECHEPAWVNLLDAGSRQAEIMKLIRSVVMNYKNYDNLQSWQVENEPFLKFSDCPDIDAGFLDQEIALVHSLDAKHPVIITDGGELGLWLPSAKRADIFGTSVYRTFWKQYFGYITYPLPPRYFWMKANLLRLFYPNKPIIVTELQEEPWAHTMSYETPVAEEMKSLNLDKFHANIDYAKQVGFPEVYLWGAEWWYWMKVKQNHPEFWEAAKDLYSTN